MMISAQIFRTVFFGGLLSVSATGLIGCDDGPDSSSVANRLTITGSSTVAPMLAVIAKRFESLNPGSRIDVQTGGSARGIADVRNNLADIGMVSRALGSKESDLQGFLIARDELTMIVHATNTISEIPSDDVVAIYKGATDNWSDLGGSGMPITVVHKAEGRSTLEVFLKKFKLKNSAIAPDVVIGENEQGIKTVEANPTAIGYVSIGTAKVAIGEGADIKLLTVTEAVPGSARTTGGKLPMYRELNLVTAKRPEGLAKRFIDFATSSAIADLVTSHSFVPPDR